MSQSFRKPKNNMFVVPLFALSLAFGLGLGGCGGGGTGEVSVDVGISSEGSSTSGDSSSSALSLWDPSTSSSTDVEAVFFTIERVDLHLTGMVEGEVEGEVEGGSWTTVATPMTTFNLLDLKNCLLEKLGSTTLAAGQSVTQIRLVLGATAQGDHPFANYIVHQGETLEITVPSGFQTGIKINPQGPVEVQEDGQVHIALVIDLAKSLVFTGSGTIHFKPVIKAAVGGETADGFLAGKVTNSADGSAIAGARISAQSFDAGASTEDQVHVENSAATDAEGNFRFCVAPGTYNVVVTKSGFHESAQKATVNGEATATVDFSLAPSEPATGSPEQETGTVSGLMTILEADAEATALLSFRKSIDLDGSLTMIEVASLTVENGATYSVTLPAGSYELVASAVGHAAVSVSVTVEAQMVSTTDVTF